MKLTRLLAATSAVAATTAATLLTVGAPQASAAPNFQMPFECGYTATAATFSDHNPQLSVDFQKDGITGDNVLAAAGGSVSRVENEGNTSYGRWVEVDHGGGWTTRYAHLSAQSVSVGDKVGQGTKLGEAGATGGVSGPHLHFEENLNGATQKAKLNGVAVPYYSHTDFTSKNNCGGGGSNPYTAEEVCGSGYQQIDKHGFGDAGSTYLLYNSGNSSNCVVTLKGSSLDEKTTTKAWLEVKGQQRATDGGSYQYYAGPVKKSAGATCVKWGGQLGSKTWTSSFEHCG